MTKFTSHKKEALGNTLQVVAKALFQSAVDMKKLASFRAPVDTGQLRQSGRVIPKKPLHITLQFARTSPEGENIAALMEYDKSLRHPRGGQAGYLQSSVDQISPKLPEYVKRFTKQ